MWDSHNETVRRLVDEVLNGGRTDVIDELYSPEFAPRAREWIAPFRESFPDVHMEIVDLIAEGDTVVGRFTCSATHTGDWLGFPPKSPGHVLPVCAMLPEWPVPVGKDAVEPCPDWLSRLGNHGQSVRAKHTNTPCLHHDQHLVPKPPERLAHGFTIDAQPLPDFLVSQSEHRAERIDLTQQERRKA